MIGTVSAQLNSGYKDSANDGTGKYSHVHDSLPGLGSVSATS